MLIYLKNFLYDLIYGDLWNGDKIISYENNEEKVEKNIYK